MKLLVAIVLAAAAMVAVSGEPPVRFHPQFRGGFGRLRQAPPFFARQQAAAGDGYQYPAPSGGYQYPKPDEPFPEPGTTTQLPATTTELPPATTTPSDYDDNATDDPEAETVEAEPVAARLRASRRRHHARRRNGQAARLELASQQVFLQDEEDDDQQQQQQQRPIYLVNVPESTLQRLVLLNQANTPAAAVLPAQLKLAPLQVAQAAAAAPVAAPIAAGPQVYITDYGLVYAKK